jgi:hypothetical protein
VNNKLSPTVGQILGNFTTTALNLNPDVQLPKHPDDCPCRSLLRNYVAADLWDGHVCTARYDIIPHRTIREALTHGRNFRFDDKPDVLRAIREALDGYTKWYTQRHTDTDVRERLRKWTTEITRICRNNIAAEAHNSTRDSSNAKLKAEVRQLHKHFVFCPVDKANQHMAIVCKPYYCHILQQELQRSKSFTPTDTASRTILQQHAEFNATHGLQHHDTLPYLYAVPKLHKPGKWRFITGVTKRAQYQQPPEPDDDRTRPKHRVNNKTCSSTTSASALASTLLQSVINQLRDNDTGPRKRCWIVKSVEEVAQDLKQNYDQVQHLTPRTWDFATMYSQLNHKRLLEGVRAAVTECAESHKSTYATWDTSWVPVLSINDKTGKHEWTIHKAHTDGYTVDDILALVTFVVGNTYVRNGGTLYRQTTGIPMGTNCAPELANLYCYYIEAKLVDSTAADTNAPNYRFCYRFIDDFLILGNYTPPHPSNYDMEYSETTHDRTTRTAVFLGMCITTQHDYLHLSVYDKQNNFTFTLTRYPSAYSNIPLHQTTGVYTGQLHRAQAICNNFDSFKEAIQALANRLLDRGHSRASLAHAFNRYIESHWDPRNIREFQLREWHVRMLHWLITGHAHVQPRTPGQHQRNLAARVQRDNRTTAQPPTTGGCTPAAHAITDVQPDVRRRLRDGEQLQDVHIRAYQTREQRHNTIDYPTTANELLQHMDAARQHLRRARDGTLPTHTAEYQRFIRRHITITNTVTDTATTPGRTRTGHWYTVHWECTPTNDDITNVRVVESLDNGDRLTTLLSGLHNRGIPYRAPTITGAQTDSWSCGYWALNYTAQLCANPDRTHFTDLTPTQMDFMRDTIVASHSDTALTVTDISTPQQLLALQALSQPAHPTTTTIDVDEPTEQPPPDTPQARGRGRVSCRPGTALDNIHDIDDDGDEDTTNPPLQISTLTTRQHGTPTRQQQPTNSQQPRTRTTQQRTRQSDVPTNFLLVINYNVHVVIDNSANAQTTPEPRPTDTPQSRNVSDSTTETAPTTESAPINIHYNPITNHVTHTSRNSRTRALLCCLIVVLLTYTTWCIYTLFHTIGRYLAYLLSSGALYTLTPILWSASRHLYGYIAQAIPRQPRHTQTPPTPPPPPSPPTPPRAPHRSFTRFPTILTTLVFITTYLLATTNIDLEYDIKITTQLPNPVTIARQWARSIMPNQQNQYTSATTLCAQPHEHSDSTASTLSDTEPHTPKPHTPQRRIPDQSAHSTPYTKPHKPKNTSIPRTPPATVEHDKCKPIRQQFSNTIVSPRLQQKVSTIFTGAGLTAVVTRSTYTTLASALIAALITENAIPYGDLVSTLHDCGTYLYSDLPHHTATSQYHITPHHPRITPPSKTPGHTAQRYHTQPSPTNTPQPHSICTATPPPPPSQSDWRTLKIELDGEFNLHNE